MAITDDPYLNEMVNGKDKGKDTSKPRYCLHCGQQLIYTTTGKDGKEDRTLKYRWRNKICYDCMQAGKHRGNSKGNKPSSREF